jgi:hypothetical protein
MQQLYFTKTTLPYLLCEFYSAYRAAFDRGNITIGDLLNSFPFRNTFGTWQSFLILVDVTYSTAPLGGQAFSARVRSNRISNNGVFSSKTRTNIYIGEASTAKLTGKAAPPPGPPVEDPAQRRLGSAQYSNMFHIRLE